ncbi:hypothetical protein E2C01_007560 [Portunus trituberculatus]|uniref:Uncharacterized protein n=1 Tax=Portunus trituberculatus TaxID=210409 RepID=A0A5B7D1H4_PORTR|nr:hypothetical protein [Portunus trituberculatus]
MEGHRKPRRTLCTCWPELPCLVGRPACARPDEQGTSRLIRRHRNNTCLTEPTPAAQHEDKPASQTRHARTPPPIPAATGFLGRDLAAAGGYGNFRIGTASGKEVLSPAINGRWIPDCVVPSAAANGDRLELYINSRRVGAGDVR